MIKVRYYGIGNDRNVEIWEIINDGGFIGRTIDNKSRHLWTYLLDPFGYCEIDKPVSLQIEIQVCDNNYKSLFCTSNDSNKYPETFLTLEEEAKKAWNTISCTFPLVKLNGFHQYLDNHKPVNLTYTQKNNFYDYFSDVTQREKIVKFMFLNQEYAILRIRYKHTLCNVGWYEYIAGNVNDTVKGYIYYFGWEP